MRRTTLGRNRVPFALLEEAKDCRIDQTRCSLSGCLIDSSSSSQGTVCNANATNAAVVQMVSRHLTQYEPLPPHMATTLSMLYSQGTPAGIIALTIVFGFDPSREHLPQGSLLTGCMLPNTTVRASTSKQGQTTTSLLPSFEGKVKVYNIPRPSV